MSDNLEKRGPIEKSNKGWPINPFGVVALAFFGIVVILFIARPLLTQKTVVIQPEQSNTSGGKIISPQAGEIIKSGNLSIDLQVDNPQDVDKVQFWAKTYADGKWQMIGEVKTNPFKLDWQIPQSFQNRAVAVTTHIYKKDGNIIKDPGGWREGIIILSP
ncbi:hypothetical protein A2165_01815 [Candidatus Curtissbacteria bacterium RBG_13_40_7]|uniref:Bacterial spore germination immunoglobulin-like domain-containing protein n=1 Tax=Candidatus Curtissbacteria bacterium RBG_13_40_7 TaxID=1797706 RepID=A0A1F5FWQ3_9BACT|nr:MAG: hypothetical protein A2165_01815 [Candidatus Curtissbacteria bacterium RBG_13_40_7]